MALATDVSERVVAVSMMKDEGDVAYAVLAHLVSEGVDEIFVADNGSRDNTRQELLRAKEDFDIPIQVIVDEEIGYYQSAKMTRLARRACRYGPAWVIPFDADELWFGEHRLADMLRDESPDVGVVNATIWNHYRTSLDVDHGNPFQSMIWRHLDKGALPKVAFRWQVGCVIHQGNHGVSDAGPVSATQLQIRHFPYRSFEHFKRKAINGSLAYKATDLPEHEGAHWRGYGEILERHGEDALREVYEKYFEFLSPMDAHMVRDPAPFRRFG